VIAGIILAGGASRRMGSPKALLDYHGETFAGRLVRVLSAICDPVIMVLGSHESVIRPQVQGPVQFVVNPDPKRGQLSSLQIALAAVPPEAEGFFFIPVDCPAVASETLERLAASFRQRDPQTLFVIPSYKGHHGHPVCGVRGLIDEFLALPPTGQARTVVHGHTGQTEYVDVEDSGVLADVDDPAAYQRLAGRAT
jgi:molybdenum cofactor cytidylyltransferase